MPPTHSTHPAPPAPEPHDEAERRIYEQVKEALDEGPKILELLRSYEGCEEPIRKALNDPGPKTEQAAWKAVSKAVDKLYEFYKFSLTLGPLLLLFLIFPFLLISFRLAHPPSEKVWPLIMDAECQSDDGASLRANVALSKQVRLLFFLLSSSSPPPPLQPPHPRPGRPALRFRLPL